MDVKRLQLLDNARTYLCGLHVQDRDLRTLCGESDSNSSANALSTPGDHSALATQSSHLGLQGGFSCGRLSDSRSAGTRVGWGDKNELVEERRSGSLFDDPGNGDN